MHSFGLQINSFLKTYVYCTGAFDNWSSFQHRTCIPPEACQVYLISPLANNTNHMTEWDTIIQHIWLNFWPDLFYATDFYGSSRVICRLWLSAKLWADIRFYNSSELSLRAVIVNCMSFECLQGRVGWYLPVVLFICVIRFDFPPGYICCFWIATYFGTKICWAKW